MGKTEKWINGVLSDIFSILPLLLLCFLLALPVSCGIVFGLGGRSNTGVVTDQQCVVHFRIVLLMTYIMGGGGALLWMRVRKWPLRWRQVFLAFSAGVLVIFVFWEGLPNVDLCQMDRGRAKRTMADMKTIAQILEKHKTENGDYPSIRALAELAPLAPEMKPSINGWKDGWGNSFRVISSKEGYWIISAGGDGELDVPRFDQYPIDKLIWPGSDFVMHNGSWIQNPFTDLLLKH